MLSVILKFLNAEKHPIVGFIVRLKFIFVVLLTAKNNLKTFFFSFFTFLIWLINFSFVILSTSREPSQPQSRQNLVSHTPSQFVLTLNQIFSAFGISILIEINLYGFHHSLSHNALEMYKNISKSSLFPNFLLFSFSSCFLPFSILLTN